MIHARQSKKSLGKEWRMFNMHDTTIITEQHTILQTETQRRPKRRKPQPAFWTECQKLWFRSWNPAEQLAGFQHLGCEIAADGEPGSELKVKPEKGWIFEEGRYNCVFRQMDNRITPQRREVLLELVLQEHREPIMRLMACISTATLNQSPDL